MEQQLETRVYAAARPSRAIVELSGESDLNTVQRLRKTLLCVARESFSRVIIDLSRLLFLCCASVQVLLDAARLMCARGATMALAAPQPIVARLLNLAGADQWIPVYPSLSMAIRAL